MIIQILCYSCILTIELHYHNWLLHIIRSQIFVLVGHEYASNFVNDIPVHYMMKRNGFSISESLAYLFSQYIVEQVFVYKEHIYNWGFVVSLIRNKVISSTKVYFCFFDWCIFTDVAILLHVASNQQLLQSSWSMKWL